MTGVNTVSITRPYGRSSLEIMRKRGLKEKAFFKGNVILNGNFLRGNVGSNTKKFVCGEGYGVF